MDLPDDAAAAASVAIGGGGEEGEEEGAVEVAIAGRGGNGEGEGRGEVGEEEGVGLDHGGLKRVGSLVGASPEYSAAGYVAGGRGGVAGGHGGGNAEGFEGKEVVLVGLVWA